MKKDYSIRKGVPVPPSEDRPRLTKWGRVAQAMEIGDSVIVEDRNKAVSLKNALLRFKKGARIVLLGKNEFGVWAIEPEE